MANDAGSTSKNIAAVLGPVLIAAMISETINFRIWDQSIPQIVYLNGMILFATGIAIVRFHNRWRPIWAALITVMGWLLLAAGTFRMFFPTAIQAQEGPATYAFISSLCLIGVVLTVMSFIKR